MDDGWKEKFPKRREGLKNKEIAAEGGLGEDGMQTNKTKQNKEGAKYQILFEYTLQLEHVVAVIGCKTKM